MGKVKKEERCIGAAGYHFHQKIEVVRYDTLQPVGEEEHNADQS